MRLLRRLSRMSPQAMRRKEDGSVSDPYGLRRVIDPPGALPQPAWRLDSRPVCGPDELLVAVDTLNVDAASFAQIRQEAESDALAAAEKILAIIRERGKLHNPVTGSGGMLMGRVAHIGPESPHTAHLKVGDRVASLVSLSLTPLAVDRVRSVDFASGQVDVDGTAVFFATSMLVRLPDDLPERVALAVCDVCGASAQTARIVRPGQTVAVLGAGGKSGLTVLAQARRNLGATGRLVAFEYAESSAARIRESGYADDVLLADARDPVATLEAYREAVGDGLAAVTVNCSSLPGTELASILVTRDRGLVYFFSMATQFAAAALGAEGVGKDIDMMIGNGYAQGHAQLALDLVRGEPWLLAEFARKTAQAGRAPESVDGRAGM